MRAVSSTPMCFGGVIWMQSWSFWSSCLQINWSPWLAAFLCIKRGNKELGDKDHLSVLLIYISNHLALWTWFGTWIAKWSDPFLAKQRGRKKNFNLVGRWGTEKTTRGGVNGSRSKILAIESSAYDPKFTPCDIPKNLLIKSLANLFSKFFIVELKT